MLKFLLSLLSITLINAQSLSNTLTQRGGEHNALFINPASLANKSIHNNIKGNLINSSLLLDKSSFNFLKELNRADNNQEVSKLLKKNIGEILSFSTSNFSSIYKNKENIAWSVGIAHTLDGYFITHSGFGSKRAMESFIEKYRALVGTVAVKKENINYGLNLKLIEKSQTIYNYAINEMVNQRISDYFDNKHTQKEEAFGVDMGIVYSLPQNYLNTKLSLAFLNIGNSSFKELGTLNNTTNIGFSIEPQKTLITIDYLHDNLRVDISKKFLNNSLKLHSGIIYNALSLGMNYQVSVFNIGLHSYKIEEAYNQEKERKYELSIALSW